MVDAVPSYRRCQSAIQTVVDARDTARVPGGVAWNNLTHKLPVLISHSPESNRFVLTVMLTF